MLPKEILEEINLYWGEKCHTCLCRIDFFPKSICNAIKQGKWYYCSCECYEFT
jgi:hypothetical protein